MNNEPEIIYKKKGIKVPILWEKTYYHDDMIGGTEKEKWEGILFLYRFLILKGSNRNRFLIEPLIEDFRGYNEEKMVDDLNKKINGLEEWKISGKHFKDANFWPEEVNNKLIEYKLEKYVKKVS